MEMELRTGTPEEAGVSPARVRRLVALADRWCNAETTPALAEAAEGVAQGRRAQEVRHLDELRAAVEENARLEALAVVCGAWRSNRHDREYRFTRVPL